MSTGTLQTLTCHTVLALALVFVIPAWADDWITVVARALGISKTPSQLRAPDDVKVGDIYIVSVSGGSPVRVTHDGGYRSPIFLPNDSSLLALKGENLLTIALASGSSQKLHTVAQALKLLGVDRSDPDKVLFLVDDSGGQAQLASLSLKNGRVALVRNDPKSAAQQNMMSHLRGDDRDYNGTFLYLESITKKTVTGSLVETDVYVKQAHRPPVNVSHCTNSQCSQPSLSYNGQRVAFIRSEPGRY
jgi:hypothetical protein